MGIILMSVGVAAICFFLGGLVGNYAYALIRGFFDGETE